jgi:ATP-dependent Clp protease protease subunit
MKETYMGKKKEEVSRNLVLGEINEETANEIIGLIYDINDEDETTDASHRTPIKLIINSPGGDVYSGFGIIDAIEGSITPIHVYVHGQAQSMAFAIASVGHCRYATKRSTFMYHECLWSVDEGKMTYHKQEVIEAERIWKMYDDVVVSNSKIPLKKLKQVRKNQKDWYINAEEALELGLIDEII